MAMASKEAGTRACRPARSVFRFILLGTSRFSPGALSEHPEYPIQAGEEDQDEDEVVERIPDSLQGNVQDVYVGYEVPPGESADQQENESDPVESVLRAHYVAPFIAVEDVEVELFSLGNTSRGDQDVLVSSRAARSPRASASASSFAQKCM